MKVTFFGHSCFLVELGATRLLFDPFISPNEAMKEVRVEDIRCDYILLSHGHFDHVADAETIARNSNATIVAAYEIATYYGAKNLKYHPMNTGGRWDFGAFQLRTVNAVHSSVLPDGTYAGNPMGFIISGEGRSFYYSGDTALTLDMQLIGQRWTPELAFLCIGDNFTMGVEDAITAAQYAGVKRVVGMHFDTFPFIKINHSNAINAFAAAGLELILPAPGQTFDL